jgi:hypothetical protein
MFRSLVAPSKAFLCRNSSILTPQVRHGTSLKIILLEDLPGKGNKGELISVKRGYARNFLIPRKMAGIVTVLIMGSFNLLVTSSDPDVLLFQCMRPEITGKSTWEMTPRLPRPRPKLNQLPRLREWNDHPSASYVRG